jgi:hypothetical protein
LLDVPALSIMSLVGNRMKPSHANKGEVRYRYQETCARLDFTILHQRFGKFSESHMARCIAIDSRCFRLVWRGSPGCA